MTDVIENNGPAPAEVNTAEVRQMTDELNLLIKRDDTPIATGIMYDLVGQELMKKQAKLKDMDEVRLSVTRPMDVAKKRVMDWFRGPRAMLVAEIENDKNRMLAYKDEQDRIAEEAARKERERAEKEAQRLREEARKADEEAARKERERLAEEQRKADERAEVERKRLAEEQRIADEKAAEEKARLDKLAEEAEADERKQKELAEEQRREKDRQEAEARRIQENKDAAAERERKEQERLHQERLDSEADQRERSARAEILEDRADAKTTAPVVSAAPKVAGISTKKVYKFEIVDKSKVPDEYKIIDEKRIRGVVNALKDDANIPGVRVYTESAMSARSS